MGGKQPKRAALYLRVSTDGQTTDNQRLALEAVAGRRGWRVVCLYEDAGISGAKGRDKWPRFDAMLRTPAGADSTCSCSGPSTAWAAALPR